MNRYGNCKECDIKIQNDDYLICSDSCLDIVEETYNHIRCIKCKEYATCSNSNICYDCNICHYDMITPTIAVGDCESSYEEFIYGNE
jgi:hypothetical protein